MPTVVVTGATGGAGRWVVDHFADAGWEVVGVDLERPDGGRPGVRFQAADLTEQGRALELIADADPDAVVHLAAIPAMGIRAGGETFENNVVSAYNVLDAAGRSGARVAWASSESIYGWVFADETWLPDYLPVDEDHPVRPEDPYGTSKSAGEDVADMVARKYGVSVASIRPSWINYPGEYGTRATRESFDPESVSPAAAANFWSYVDVRDVASMFEAAVTADFDGHEAFLCAAAENYLDRPTADVVEAAFGDLPAECDLSGDDAALSTAKADRVLDWAPEHSWRTAEEADVDGPPF